MKIAGQSLPTPLRARMHLALDVHGVGVSLKEIPASLRRFCRPAFFHHEDASLDLSKTGSAFQLRYRGRNFVLLTRHQLGANASAVKAEQFTVALVQPDNTRIGLSPNEVSRIKLENPEHANLDDLLLLRYENERDGRNLRPLFLDLDLGLTLREVHSQNILAMFAIGYPTAADDYDVEYDDDGNVTKYDMQLRWTSLYLARDQAALLDTENRIPMVQAPDAEQEIIQPDGMSGAPVFFLTLDGVGRPRLGFAGMITDAKPDRYMIYDGALIRQILDEYIDTP